MQSFFASPEGGQERKEGKKDTDGRRDNFIFDAHRPSVNMVNEQEEKKFRKVQTCAEKPSRAAEAL